MSDSMVKSLLVSAGWINGLLITGMTLAGAIILLRFTGKSEFEAWKVRVKTTEAWIIFALLTGAHFYATVVFLRDCRSLLASGAPLRAAAWQSLTSESLLFFHGLVARLKHTDIPVVGSVYWMDRSDPITWLTYAGALELFAAIVVFRNVSRSVRIGTAFAGLLIVAANWSLGARWAIEASRLCQASGLRCG